jgi:transcriptional regulator with XRE-family HTH domain
MSQVDLAHAITSTQRAISYYEVQGGNPDTPVLIQLAQALGVTVDELVGAQPLPKITTPIIEPETKRYWRRFLQLMDLPEKDQRAVFRTIDSMVRAQQMEQAAKKKRAG